MAEKNEIISMFKGKNVALREIEDTDLIQLKKWRNSSTVRPYVREFKLLNMLDQKKWFESLSSLNDIMFAIENNKNIMMGCCGLTYIDWKNGHAEISIYLGYNEWQNKIHASEAIQILLKYGFNELRLHRIYAIIFSYNKKNIELFEKNKFKLDGVIRDSRFWNGKYYDEMIYSILEKEMIE